MSAKRKVKAEPAGPTKLDLGCGKNPREGFTGVDSRDFGQAITLNLVERNALGLAEAEAFRSGKMAGEPAHSWAEFKPWPWADSSIEECHCSHFVEHLTGPERIHFVNELWRVLKPGGKATIITPHWASCRAYGDLTHQWPPVSEFWFYYLSKAWRDSQAPHNDGYTCDFDAVWGYGMRPEIQTKNQEYQQYAMANYKEAITDMQATLTAKK